MIGHYNRGLGQWNKHLQRTASSSTQRQPVHGQQQLHGPNHLSGSMRSRRHAGRSNQRQTPLQSSSFKVMHTPTKSTKGDRMDERIEMKWKCGHTETHTFGYTTGDMKAKMRLMASTLGVCMMCSTQKAADDHWAQMQILLRPRTIVMTGSQRQVEWARQIRASMYDSLAVIHDQLRQAHLDQHQQWGAIVIALRPVLEELRRWRLYTYAGDIIEHRNMTWSLMFGDALNRAGLRIKGLTK